MGVSLCSLSCFKIVNVFRILVSALPTFEIEFPAGHALAKAAKSAPGFSGQFNCHPLARGVHTQFAIPFRHQPARVFDQDVNAFVVVVGVVVKQTKLFDPGLQRERDRIVHTTVPPAAMLPVFGGIVLRIENEHVRIADKFDHFAVVAAGARLGVGEKGDQTVGRRQPVADAQARMIRAQRLHTHRADVEIEILEFLNFDVARQFVERDGKVGTFHLAGQSIDQAFSRALATQNPQPAA